MKNMSTFSAVLSTFIYFLVYFHLPSSTFKVDKEKPRGSKIKQICLPYLPFIYREKIKRQIRA